MTNLDAAHRSPVVRFVLSAAMVLALLPACGRDGPDEAGTGTERGSRSPGRTDEERLDVKKDRSGRFAARFEVMGTWASLITAAGNEEEARAFLTPAAAAIRSVEEEMSTFRPGSGISRLNRMGLQGEVALPPDTMHVLREAKLFSSLTDGAFDITYAPLRTLWRAAGKADRLPEDEEIAGVLAAVGSDKLVLTERTARLDAPGMEVDLGGIAKGFAIDRAVEALVEAGSTSALVDIGGDIRTLGSRPDSAPWKIEINDPRAGDPPPIRLLLSDCAVATSGDYLRTFDVAGQRFSHIVDPRTGLPVKDVPSVTVVASKAIAADSLATAISVLGPTAGLNLVNGLDGVECLIMARGTTGEVTLLWTTGFLEIVQGGEESLHQPGN